MKVKLNKRVIDDAEYQGPGGYYLWDTDTAGFGLRIYPSGRKVFVISYRARGRQRFYTLGRYGELTPHQAKTEALETLARARRGEDPSGERIAGRKAPTVADLGDRYVRDHAKLKKKPKYIARDRNAWDRLVRPSLGKRKVNDIRRTDVAKLMTSLAKTPSMANRLLTLLSSAFNLAEVWEWRPEGSNPCRKVARYKEEGRERYLAESELARLGETLVTAEQHWGYHPTAIAAIRLLILTGCRSAEILKLRWQDVDLERRCLHLPDSKTGKRTVMLNTAALAVLASFERDRSNPHVIVGAKPGSHRATLQNVWTRICAEADLHDVRVHDLRHTYASYGVNGGQSLAVVGKLLGHSKITTTQRYAHLADDPIRQASEAIGATLAATMEGRPKASIENISRATNAIAAR